MRPVVPRLLLLLVAAAPAAAQDFPAPVATAGDDPNALAVADLDGDGAPDFACSLSAGPPGSPGLSITLSLPDGRWSEPVLYAAGKAPMDVAIGLLDGDGHPDVAVCHALPQTVTAFYGSGGGALDHSASYFVGGTLRALSLADLNGDGLLDLVTLSSDGAGAIHVNLADGSDGYLAAASYPAGGTGWEMDAGDVNNDGDLDVVAGHDLTQLVSVLAGDGAGGLGAPVTQAVPGSPRDLLLADGAGDWLPPEPYLTLGHAQDAEPGDLDGDGAPDVAATEPFRGVRVWRGDGAGGLLPPLRFQTGEWAANLAIADLDGDARPELLVGGAETTYTKGSVALLANLTTPFTWADLGFALAGTAGEPNLHGHGELVPGTPGSLALFHARPLALAVLFVGAQAQPTAFKGGTLVPLPPLAHFTVVTDAAGALSLGWSAWPSNAPGQDWYFQYGIADPVAVHGVALSNALRATEP